MATLEERYEHLEKTIHGYNISADFAQIRAAFEYARDHHGDQKRKDGSLFITHPLNVAQIVAEMRLDTESIVAALLQILRIRCEITLKGRVPVSVIKIHSGIVQQIGLHDAELRPVRCLHKHRKERQPAPFPARDVEMAVQILERVEILGLETCSVLPYI